MRGGLGGAAARLEALQARATALGAACEAFSKDAAGVLAQRAANKQLLCEPFLFGCVLLLCMLFAKGGGQPPRFCSGRSF